MLDGDAGEIVGATCNLLNAGGHIDLLEEVHASATTNSPKHLLISDDESISLDVYRNGECRRAYWRSMCN